MTRRLVSAVVISVGLVGAATAQPSGAMQPPPDGGMVPKPAEPMPRPMMQPTPGPMIGGASMPGYGAAGCGLGSIIFGAEPGFTQVFAATTNATSFSQTFGITSGTSNCASTDTGLLTAREFVESNREAFAKDVSRGSGETIASLATLSGCRSPQAVGRSLQKNFKAIFPSAKVSNTQVSAAAIQALRADKQLGCAQLI
ncbi:MAG: hypothetical protein H6Q90_6832 [Deltaproteobacteria bacterium]|nr:hypothetical protein [Deltaproteobacteria bacterium]